MKILVTGGAGFIGGHLIDSLLEDPNNMVLCIDNLHENEAEKVLTVNKHQLSDNYMFDYFDITNDYLLKRSIKDFKPQIIIHLAALAGIRQSILYPEQCYTTNVSGTLNLLEKFKIHKPEKLIFASSSSVYGNNNELPFSEDHQVSNPISPYAASKISGETICSAWANIYQVPTTVLRFFNVYGTRQRPDLALRKFITANLTGQPITIFGDGETSRDYTHVNDIVKGITAAMHYDQKKIFEIFNLGNSLPTSLHDLVYLIEEITGIPFKKEYAPEQPGEMKHTYANINKAHDLLGFYMRTNFSDGVKEMINWIKGM